VSRSYAFLIGSLAAIWGASYLFIKVAVRDFPPAAMMEVRLALSGVILAGFVVFGSGRRQAVADLRGTGWQAFAVGIVNGAIPFTLIAWASATSTPASPPSRTQPCRSSTPCSCRGSCPRSVWAASASSVSCSGS